MPRVTPLKHWYLYHGWLSPVKYLKTLGKTLFSWCPKSLLHPFDVQHPVPSGFLQCLVPDQRALEGDVPNDVHASSLSHGYPQKAKPHRLGLLLGMGYASQCVLRCPKRTRYASARQRAEVLFFSRTYGQVQVLPWRVHAVRRPLLQSPEHLLSPRGEPGSTEIRFSSSGGMRGVRQMATVRHPNG